MQPGKQRDGRELRENDEARLHQYHAEAVKNLAKAFGHYNEWHPHSAPGYRSPREYLRRRTSNDVMDAPY
ncbi:integrase core domain-containing protein [Kosakonia sp. S42]|uniref:integrase core domain-containing protein n=1 Tax=Kosakonia sp. S42 TaxID=2767458 RepID=UPI0035C7F13E